MRRSPKSTMRIALTNPRPPAAPATLDITLEEYYAAAGAIGLLSAQIEEPDPEWVCEWSHKFGATMAEAARKRRRLKMKTKAQRRRP